MANRDKQLVADDDTVGIHTREFHPLSNFAAFRIEWRGRTWPTAEHAYQAAKFLEINPEIADQIQEAKSPYKAKEIAHEHEDKVADRFYESNVKLMKEICRAKLDQHQKVREKLTQTGDRRIVEDSPNDKFWGTGADGSGENKLGKIWMQLRDELQE